MTLAYAPASAGWRWRTHLLVLDGIGVPHIGPGGREERNGRQQKHDVLVVTPGRLECQDKPLVFLVHVHVAGRCLQNLQLDRLELVVVLGDLQDKFS